MGNIRLNEDTREEALRNPGQYGSTVGNIARPLLVDLLQNLPDSPSYVQGFENLLPGGANIEDQTDKLVRRLQGTGLSEAAAAAAGERFETAGVLGEFSQSETLLRALEALRQRLQAAEEDIGPKQNPIATFLEGAF